jgi:hypothetical protein
LTFVNQQYILYIFQLIVDFQEYLDGIQQQVMEHIIKLNEIFLQLLEIFHLLLNDMQLEDVLLILLILIQQLDKIILVNVHHAFKKYNKNYLLKIKKKTTNQFLNGYAYNPGNDGRAVKAVRERE